jgi:nicotinamide-nucleotide amidase
MAGVGLVRDEPSLEHIRQLFASRGREMPERNIVQADFPAGARPIPNQHGTAPGIELRVEPSPDAACTVFALPGVPAEMKPMWHAHVLPAITALLPSARVIRHRRIKCFGAGESQLEAMLPDIIRRGRDPLVGITVSDATITLRITAAGENDAACQALIEPTVATIREALGTLVFGEGDDELEHVVARLLAEQRKTLAIAEWATGGLVEDWLQATTPDNAGFLSIGLTANSAAQLAKVLPLTKEQSADLSSAAPHDSAVATLMAEGIRNLSGADVGLGIAAFPPDSDAAEARVHVSIATPDRTRRLRFGCSTHPAIRRARTAKQALNALRLTLTGEDQHIP